MTNTKSANSATTRGLSFSAMILAVGCSGLLPSVQAQTAPCNAGVCKASVTVQACASGTLAVTPDPIPVPAPNNIQWTIDTAGYRFAQNGIVVAGSGFKPSPGATGNGKKFIVHDDHTDKRPNIKYTIRVVKDDGTACAAFDPFINNQ